MSTKGWEIDLHNLKFCGKKSHKLHHFWEEVLVLRHVENKIYQNLIGIRHPSEVKVEVRNSLDLHLHHNRCIDF